MSLLLYPLSILCSLISIIIGTLIFKRPKLKFPIINKNPQDFITNARHLLKTGFLTHGSNPYVIQVPNGRKLILPPTLINWVKNNKDVDHQQLVREDFFANYPGFEAQFVLHHENRMVINMIQGKLSKTDKTLSALYKAIKNGLSEIWGESKEWKTLDWEDNTTGIISRAASSIFVGPELASDPEWQTVSRKYVLDFFSAVPEMQSVHPWLRSLRQYSLPRATACRTGLARAREMVNNVVQKRRQEVDGPAYYDALAWTMENPAAEGFEPGDVQLALAMAALFTTSELFRQILVEIARRPEYVEPLRKEIEDAMGDGVTGESLVKMGLLDSFMKECQRQIPPLGKSLLLVTVRN
jgi:hypothetical protein